MYDVQTLRQTEFPHSNELTYLNHAGISPLPQRAKREIQAAVEALSRDPNDYFGKVGLPAIIDLQSRLARFINAAGPSEIVAITSTSAALNAVAFVTNRNIKPFSTRAEALDWLVAQH